MLKNTGFSLRYFGDLIAGNPILYSWMHYIQGGQKKSLWCDLEEKYLRNSKLFFMESFSLYIHIF